MWTLWPSSELFATEVPPTHMVLATYLHKLIGYIEWPSMAFPHADAPIMVGVVGSPETLESLRTVISGRPIQGRSIEVHELQKADGVSNMHLLHISASAWAARAQHWKTVSLRERATVVTTDAPDGIDQGATIGFRLSGQGVRIDASLPAADAAGVKLSSRLLQVADRVVERPR